MKYLLDYTAVTQWDEIHFNNEVFLNTYQKCFAQL